MIQIEAEMIQRRKEGDEKLPEFGLVLWLGTPDAVEAEKRSQALVNGIQVLSGNATTQAPKLETVKDDSNG